MYCCFIIIRKQIIKLIRNKAFLVLEFTLTLFYYPNFFFYLLNFIFSLCFFRNDSFL